MDGGRGFKSHLENGSERNYEMRDFRVDSIIGCCQSEAVRPIAEER